MRLIDADARVTVQSFDPMNEEYDHTEMTIEQALNFSTDEGCPQVVDCNDCAMLGACDKMPEWGRPLRYNCPLWEAEVVDK